MISRRRSREFLLQSLYSRAQLGASYDRATFLSSYYEEENVIALEITYIDAVEAAILTHENELLMIVNRLAPKFDLVTMPVLHILIIMIALSEMIYLSELAIPESVSINEAIELAKRFSDDHGKQFINGALSTFLKNREGVLAEKKDIDFRVFSCVHSC